MAGLRQWPLRHNTPGPASVAIIGAVRVSRYLLCTVALAFMGAAACGLSLQFSRHGFSGYDVSPMIDAGWRVYQGQVPGRDFVVTFPASLYLLTALSFHSFGVTWHALALGACCVYATLLALGLRLGALLRRQRGEATALWVTLAYAAGQTIPLVSINYLWHASLAESFALYAVFAAFVLTPAKTHPPSRWLRLETSLHLTLACAFLLLSKPNTAFPAMLLCLAILWRTGYSRVHVASVLGGAVVLASAALAWVHVTPWGMLGAYAGLTGRLLPRAFVNGILYALYARYGMANLLVYAILAPGMYLALTYSWRLRAKMVNDPGWLLAAGSLAIALLGMGTNFDFKLTDAPLALLGLAILSAQEIPALQALRFRTAVATAALVLLAVYFGRTRFRMQIVGSWADDKCAGQVHFDDRFLGNFSACPIVPATLAEVDQTLATERAAHVFFGPSLEFLYAGRGLASPLHLPNWWDPGTSYALRRTDQVADAWEQNHFDLLIFPAEEDRAQLPARVQDDLRERYILIPGTKLIHVYRPR